VEAQPPPNLATDASSGINYSSGIYYFLASLAFSLFCLFTFVPEFDATDTIWIWGWPVTLIVLLFFLVRLNHEMPDKDELSSYQGQIWQGKYFQQAFAAQTIVVILHFGIWIFNEAISDEGPSNLIFQSTYLALAAVTSYSTWIWSSGELPNIASIARLGEYLRILEKDRRVDVRIFSVKPDEWKFVNSELTYSFDPRWSVCVVRSYGATEWNCLSVPTARKLDLPIRPRIRDLDRFCIDGQSLLLHNEVKKFLNPIKPGDSELDFHFSRLSPLQLFSETNVHGISIKSTESDGGGLTLYSIACHWDFSKLRHAAEGIKSALVETTNSEKDQGILKLNLVNVYCMLCTQEISPSVSLFEEENDGWLSGLNAYCEFVTQSMHSIEFIEETVGIPAGRKLVPLPSSLFTFSPLHSFHSEYVSLSKLDLSSFQNDDLEAHVMTILSASIDVLARFSKQFDNKGDLASQHIKSYVLLTLAMGLFSVRFYLEGGR